MATKFTKEFTTYRHWIRSLYIAIHQDNKQLMEKFDKKGSTLQNHLNAFLTFLESKSELREYGAVKSEKYRTQLTVNSFAASSNPFINLILSRKSLRDNDLVGYFSLRQLLDYEPSNPNTTSQKYTVKLLANHFIVLAALKADNLYLSKNDVNKIIEELDWRISNAAISSDEEIDKILEELIVELDQKFPAVFSRLLTILDKSMEADYKYEPYLLTFFLKCDSLMVGGTESELELYFEKRISSLQESTSGEALKEGGKRVAALLPEPSNDFFDELFFVTKVVDALVELDKYDAILAYFKLIEKKMIAKNRRNQKKSPNLKKKDGETFLSKKVIAEISEEIPELFLSELESFLKGMSDEKLAPGYKQILDKWGKRLESYQSDSTATTSVINRSLDDLEMAGIVKKVRDPAINDGKKSIHDTVFLSQLIDLSDSPMISQALHFYKEISVLGTLGHLICRNNNEKYDENENIFTFKHYYPINKLDEEVSYELLYASQNKLRVDIEFEGSHEKKSKSDLLPLKLYSSVRNGRQHMVFFSKEHQFYIARVDEIESVTLQKEGKSTHKWIQEDENKTTLELHTRYSYIWQIDTASSKNKAKALLRSTVFVSSDKKRLLEKIKEEQEEQEEQERKELKSESSYYIVEADLSRLSDVRLFLLELVGALRNEKNNYPKWTEELGDQDKKRELIRSINRNLTKRLTSEKYSRNPNVSIGEEINENEEMRVALLIKVEENKLLAIKQKKQTKKKKETNGQPEKISTPKIIERVIDIEYSNESWLDKFWQEIERAEEQRQIELLYNQKYGELIEAEKYMWNVDTPFNRNEKKPEHLAVKLFIRREEQYVVDRIKRESRNGVLKKISETDLYLFEVDLYELRSIRPFIRTFIGRIVEIKCSDPKWQEEFWQEVQQSYELYHD